MVLTVDFCFGRVLLKFSWGSTMLGLGGYGVDTGRALGWWVGVAASLHFSASGFTTVLLRHSCCPSTFSSRSVFCPNPWALLNETCRSLRQGCWGNWLPFSSSPCRKLWPQEAVSSFLPIYPPDSGGSKLWKLLCGDHSLRWACVQVRCYLLSFWCSTYCYFTRRDPGTFLILPCFSVNSFTTFFCSFV